VETPHQRAPSDLPKRKTPAKLGSDGSGTTDRTADSSLRVLGSTLLSGHILRPAGARPTSHEPTDRLQGTQPAKSRVRPVPVEDTTNTMSEKRHFHPVREAATMSL